MQPQVRIFYYMFHAPHPFLITQHSKTITVMLDVSCIMRLAVFWCIEGPALEVVEEIKKSGGDAVAVKADCKWLVSYGSNSSLNGRDFQILWLRCCLSVGSSVEEISNMFNKAVEAFGTVDVLVNNAGITKDGLVARMKPEQWQSVIDINLSGVFYCTQAFFKVI